MNSRNTSEVGYQFIESMLQDSGNVAEYSYNDHIDSINNHENQTLLECKQAEKIPDDDIIEKTYVLLVEGSTGSSQDTPKELIPFYTIDDNLDEEISEYDVSSYESQSFSSLDDVNDDDEQSREADDAQYEFLLKDNTYYYYKCKLCSYETTKIELLHRHLRKHSDVYPHVCLICDRSFKLAITLKAHYNFHKRVKSICCSYCGHLFSSSGELIRHTRYKHTFEKPHKCDICDYRCVERSKLYRHKRSHTGERPYQCPHCTYATQDSFRLKRHIRKHTGDKPFNCDICGRRFTQSNSVTLHMKLHYAKSSFQCQHCMSSFTRISDLRTHIQRQHMPGDSKVCPRCPQVFLDKYSLRIHKKTHRAGRKLFKCHFCGYCTTNKIRLLSHYVIHENEKSFKCTHCQLIFREKKVLCVHERLHRRGKKHDKKMFTCNECDRQFSYKGYLIRHIMNKHELSTL